MSNIGSQAGLGSRRRQVSAGVVLAALALVGCSSPSGAAAPSSSPAVGVPVVDGGVEFVVQGVVCTTEPMTDGTYAPLPPKGQFCKVAVSATAQRDIGMFLGDITITTAAIPGEVSPDVAAMLYAGTLKPDYISKGQTLVGDVVFDVSKDDSVTSVFLKATPASQGVKVSVE